MHTRWFIDQDNLNQHHPILGRAEGNAADHQDIVEDRADEKTPVVPYVSLRKRGASTTFVHPQTGAEPSTLSELVMSTEVQQQKRVKLAASQAHSSETVEVTDGLNEYTFHVATVIAWLETRDQTALKLFLNSVFAETTTLSTKGDITTTARKVSARERFELVLTRMRSLWEWISRTVLATLHQHDADKRSWLFAELYTLCIREWYGEFVRLLIISFEPVRGYWGGIRLVLKKHFHAWFYNYLGNPNDKTYDDNLSFVLYFWLHLSLGGVMHPRANVLQIMTEAVARISSNTTSTRLGAVWQFFVQKHQPLSEVRASFLLFTLYDYLTFIRETRKKADKLFKRKGFKQFWMQMKQQEEQWYPDFHRNRKYRESLPQFGEDREVLRLWTAHCGILQGASKCQLDSSSKSYTRRRMDRVLANAPRSTVPFYVYRGVPEQSNSRALARANERGSYYLTTTFDLDVPFEFYNEDNECCVFRILVPVGTPFMYIDEHVSAYGGTESEVIFPRNYQLQATINEEPPWNDALTQLYNYYLGVLLKDVTLVYGSAPDASTTSTSDQPPRIVMDPIDTIETAAWNDLLKYVNVDAIRREAIENYRDLAQTIRAWQLKWYGASDDAAMQREEFSRLLNAVVQRLPDEIFEALFSTREEAKDYYNKFPWWS